MKRTRTVEYQSCDLCDNPEETTRVCDICHKYVCREHSRAYPWGDQIYYFCSQHFRLVESIIGETGIPMGFVVAKLTGKMSGYTEKQFTERGYAALWNAEWESAGLIF